MKKQNGITLIALIITIVIMIILATIAISSVNDTDILSQTEGAASRLNELQKNEAILRNELLEELKPSNPEDPDPIDPDPEDPDPGNNSHNYTETETPPTCTTEGVRTYTCTNCGDTYTESIPAKGHTEVTVPGEAATCTETGLTEGKKCSECGATLLAQNIILASHSYETTESVTSTCSIAGYVVRTCTKCGDTQRTNYSLLSHSWKRTENKCGYCGGYLEVYDKCTLCGTVVDYTSYYDMCTCGEDTYCEHLSTNSTTWGCGGFGDCAVGYMLWCEDCGETLVYETYDCICGEGDTSFKTE